MPEKIVLAGATGNLGKRIAQALTESGAEVVALVKLQTPEDKTKPLQAVGAKVKAADLSSPEAIGKTCEGAACVVSAVQGLSDVIVDAQTALLEGAAAARVPRFIPSDYSSDYRNLTPGENRNFDLRREFHERLAEVQIASTSIFNGAFTEILLGNTPLLDFEKKTVGYWENPDWRIDFTTRNDTAAYTAAAALDRATPKALCIASFSVSPRELVEAAGKAAKSSFRLVRLGSLEELRNHNKEERKAHPEGENEVFPQWQQGQYMQSMFSGHHESLDNERYPNLKWTSLVELLTENQEKARGL